MNIIVCVDNRMGTMFNKRRQSRDRILCQRVLSKIKGKKLLINGYSSDLFKEYDFDMIVDDEFLKIAEKGDFCFVEGDSVLPFEDKIETIIVFRWNRDYPSDTYFDIDLTDGWLLDTSEDFVGSSHEKITMETYVRK